MTALQDYQLNIDLRNALVYYKGPFDEEVLVRISSYLREGISSSKKITRKVFSIFIELAQNIAKYSSEHNHFPDFEDKHGVGVLAICKKEEEYVLKAGNLVRLEIAQELKQRCEHINQLDNQGLKKLRKEMNMVPLGENAPGGNIGLLQIALKSEHPIQIDFEEKPHSQLAFLVISTIVTNS